MRKAALLSLLSMLSLGVALAVAPVGATAAPVARAAAAAPTTSSLGTFSPTFTGPAATGCASAGCSLLSNPIQTSSTANLSLSNRQTPDAVHALPPTNHLLKTKPHTRASAAAAPALLIPSVSCAPLGPGCDTISTSSGGATGVKGLDAVDSASLSTNPLGDVEPPDQGLCAGNGYVVEANNIGEILVFNTALNRLSSPIPLDTLMGLTGKGWSSGGDPSCLYDQSNGGHWFFTQFVSTNSEASGGPFTGCFAAVANTCQEGIAVTTGSDPFGPYNVYFLNANYNPNEPGYPYLLNDYAKISTTRDAFLLFYDEFPQLGGGIGGGFFNGSQEFAFSKDALELGLPTTLGSAPNPLFNVAIMNLGTAATPDGTCVSDNTFHAPGVSCWYQTIPAQAPDPSQWDNDHDGSGFMLSSLDFYGNGDNRIAAFDWTGLGNLNSFGCQSCGSIQFGGTLLSGLESYRGEGFLGAQKAGPVPLALDCRLIPPPTPKGKCTENGIATNGDGFTQVSQAQGQIWGAVTTEIQQTYTGGAATETHQGAAYWVVSTKDLSLTSQGLVSLAHEDLEFATMAAEGSANEDGGNGGGIMSFTLSGNGGPTGADNGGFFPSSAFGRVSSTSAGLIGSVADIADPGQSPYDGASEYAPFPVAGNPPRPRWGDYGWALFVPNSGGRIYFASEYIEYPSCTGKAFTDAIGTCNGTRDFLANWGTSVNYVVP